MRRTITRTRDKQRYKLQWALTQARIEGGTWVPTKVRLTFSMTVQERRFGGGFCHLHTGEWAETYQGDPWYWTSDPARSYLIDREEKVWQETFGEERIAQAARIVEDFQRKEFDDLLMEVSL